MKKRKMSALQKKYFGKGHKVAHSKPKKVKHMAKKRRKGHSYARRGIGGIKGLILPIGAGVAEQYINNFIPVNGVGATAVGMFGHNETLKTIGLYQIGLSLGNIIPLPGIGSNAGGGF